MVPRTKEKNFTVYNAISHDYLPTYVLRKDVATAEKKICVCVGSLAVHKNHIKLLEAFRIIADNCSDMELVIVGNYKTRYGSRVRRLCQSLNLQERVSFLGSLDFNGVLTLLQSAMFSVNISLLEGFCLPLLESMAIGCPVICSNTTVFPEVGSDAVCYCDPLNPHDVAGKMMKLYLDENYRKQLSRLGLERAKRFTWRGSALKLLSIFDKVIESC
jgi:glycosyltransferase involved in cell wall biosynthesis